MTFLYKEGLKGLIQPHGYVCSPSNLLTNSMPITHFFYFFHGGGVAGGGLKRSLWCQFNYADILGQNGSKMGSLARKSENLSNL